MKPERDSDPTSPLMEDACRVHSVCVTTSLLWRVWILLSWAKQLLRVGFGVLKAVCRPSSPPNLRLLITGQDVKLSALVQHDADVLSTDDHRLAPTQCFLF